MSDNKIKLLGKEWDEQTIREIAEEEIAKLTSDLSDEETKVKELNMIADMFESMKAFEKAEDVLKFLEIPSFGGKVDATQLVAILMDETKLQQLVSKLKNKMFW